MSASSGIPNLPGFLSSFVQITKATLPLANLLQGEQLTVSVNQKLPENLYVMTVKGQQVTVRSDAPFIEGQKIQARVHSLAPQMILEVIEPAGQTSTARPSEIPAKTLPTGVVIQVLGKAPQEAQPLKSAPSPAFQLVAGQMLPAVVEKKISGNRYWIAAKDVLFEVTSEIPLKEGDKIQIKVQSLSPQTTIILVDAQKQSTDAKISEKLLPWRMNAEALPQLLAKSSEFLANLKQVSIPSGFSARDVEVLIRIFRNLVFSGVTKGNPLFIKEFIQQMGMNLEKDLAALVSGKTSTGLVVNIAENLKANLLKLSEALDLALKSATKTDPAMQGKIQALVSFTDETIKTIESRQSANVIYQQNENGLYLQIPVAVGGAYRQAEIFIRPDDKNARESEKFSSCSVTIFLDLDYLGALTIEAGVHKGNIRCIIKCENEQTRELLDASSERLREALADIGYSVGALDCVQANDWSVRKAEFVARQILGQTDFVNFFA